MPTGTQQGSSSLAIALRTGDNDAHFPISPCMILSENRFPLFGIMHQSKNPGPARCLSSRPASVPIVGVLAASATGNITCSAAVRPRDQSAKFDGITGDGCMPGDWRLARAVKCGEESPLANERC